MKEQLPPVDTAAVLDSIDRPMQYYLEKMARDLDDWQPLEDFAQRLLEGSDADEGELIPAFRPLVKMMRLIVKLTAGAGWDWTSPEVQATFQEVAGGEIYTVFSDVLVDMLAALLQQVDVGTVVEVGTGPGRVTAALCRALQEQQGEHVRLILSDQAANVRQTGDTLRAAYPALDITDYVWDLRQAAPRELVEHLTGRVLVFERFCLPYSGYGAIDTIAPLADVLLLVDDLSVTGRKASFDMIYEKIGTQFLVLETAKRYLEKYFSHIHVCDNEIVAKVNSPVVSFTLAMK